MAERLAKVIEAKRIGYMRASVMKIPTEILATMNSSSKCVDVKSIGLHSQVDDMPEATNLFKKNALTERALSLTRSFVSDEAGKGIATYGLIIAGTLIIAGVLYGLYGQRSVGNFCRLKPTIQQPAVQSAAPAKAPETPPKFSLHYCPGNCGLG